MNQTELTEEQKKELLNGQQKVVDGTIEEQLPEEMQCPQCFSAMIRVTTKRGFHYKCSNSKCGWDTNRIFDFAYHQKYVQMVADKLKRMFPSLNFVENLPMNINILTGEKQEATKKYDLSAYWFGVKIARIRVEVNRHIDYNRFFETEENYVLGNPQVVEYLSKRDALLLHFLVNEQDENKQIGISEVKSIVGNCKQVVDRFQNMQYHIPKELRRIIVTFDRNKIEDLLFKGFHRRLYGEILIR